MCHAQKERSSTLIHRLLSQRDPLLASIHQKRPGEIHVLTDESHILIQSQPCRPDIGAYMSDELVSELPALRVHAVLALTKMLHFVKLRSLCGGSPERLLLQKTQNPLKQKVKLEQPLDPNYTENFIKGLRSPMEAGKTLLMDKQSTGWLVWGDEVEYYTAPRQTGDQLVWEQESDAGLQAIREVILNPEWWTKVADHYSREQSRDFLAQENTALIKSIFQIVSASSKICNQLIERLPVLDGSLRTGLHSNRSIAQ